MAGHRLSANALQVRQQLAGGVQRPGEGPAARFLGQRPHACRSQVLRTVKRLLPPIKELATSLGLLLLHGQALETSHAPIETTRYGT